MTSSWALNDMIQNACMIFVALLHVWFLILECFLWTKPLGRKVFRMNAEKAQMTKVLAFNQGIYNGFLAAGLFWGVSSGDIKVKVFFLACVAVAGIAGAFTVSKNILFIQALPALIALGLLL